MLVFYTDVLWNIMDPSKGFLCLLSVRIICRSYDLPIVIYSYNASMLLVNDSLSLGQKNDRGRTVTGLNVFWRLWYSCSNEFVLPNGMIKMFWWVQPFFVYRIMDTILIISVVRDRFHNRQNTYKYFLKIPCENAL